jgi:arylsulfatase A-like enzyme
MNRRQFLAAASAPLLNAESQSRPNVVLIMTDDQGYGDLSCHGNPILKTPHIDALHARSLHLVNYHVSPTCSPTRSALLTGRYTDSTGAWHTIMGRSLLRKDEITLADCFKQAGYATGIFGKWHLGDNHPCRPQDRGFTETVVHGGGGVWQTPDHFGNDYADDTYLHNGKPQKYEGFCTDVWFQNAQRFIAQSKAQAKPFFCYIPTNAPHGPMWAPESYRAKYANAPGRETPGFFGMIANIDDNVGRLVQFLKSQSLDKNTILIFTTDNGTSSGELVHNAGMRGKKGSPYEGGHRVPFFLHWPAGGFDKPRDEYTLAAHIDVLPTLLDYCQIDRPNGKPLHGRSLRPILSTQTARWPDRAIITDSQRMEHLVKWRQAAVMTANWRLVSPSQDGDTSKLELYEIEKDPAQKNNVIAQNPAVAQRLKSEYEKFWAEVSPGSDEPVRISLGHPSENPVRLTAHDWHGEGAEKVWNQSGIRNAPLANGWWALDVLAAGRYKFQLRRWPPELDLPITAPYADAQPNRDKNPGKAIDCVKARIEIAGAAKEQPVPPNAKSADFTLDLKQGPADLRTFLIAESGAERGAYFVTVEKL